MEENECVKKEDILNMIVEITAFFNIISHVEEADVLDIATLAEMFAKKSIQLYACVESMS